MLPDYLSSEARDLITQLMERDPSKRLVDSSAIQTHSFFSIIDWDKVLAKQYIPPNPYLKDRFDTFLSLPLNLKTNKEVSEKFQRDQAAPQSNPFGGDYIANWSFAE